jgi:hypothetical protein
MKADKIVIALVVISVLVVGYFTIKYLRMTNAAIKASKE